MLSAPKRILLITLRPLLPKAINSLLLHPLLHTHVAIYPKPLQVYIACSPDVLLFNLLSISNFPFDFLQRRSRFVYQGTYGGVVAILVS